MVSTYVKCEHPATARYWDLDELRCRACATSLTFPPRPPGPDDKADRLQDARLAQGESKRVYVPLESLDNTDLDDNTGGHYQRRRFPEGSCIQCQTTLDLIPDSGRVECGRCGQVLLTVDADGQHRLPPFTPPRLLSCSCCKSMLPQFSFSKQAKMVNREGRNSACKGCLAFRSRIRREQRPEEIRAKDRLRMAEYWRTAQAKGRQRSPTSPADSAAAAKRHRARKAGRDVLLQRPGRSPMLMKPVCRVAASCPLRSFCSVESKGVG